MKIKKGDKVQVITGAYKDTVGEVTAVFPKENRIIVEGVNIVKKHMKPTQQNPDGGIISPMSCCMMKRRRRQAVSVSAWRQTRRATL